MRTKVLRSLVQPPAQTNQNLRNLLGLGTTNRENHAKKKTPTEAILVLPSTNAVKSKYHRDQQVLEASADVGTEP